MVEYFHGMECFLPGMTGGGQAKICGRYADLVGTKKADLQIFSLVLQIFSMRHNGEILIFSRKSTSKMDRLSRF